MSDSSVLYDRRVKAPLYAGMGVPEVWVVNLPLGCVEVHDELRDGAYTRVRRFSTGERVAIAAFPDVALAVDAVLPS